MTTSPEQRGDAASFSSYFAGRAVAERGFVWGAPDGAQALADASDVVIHRWDERGLKVACMVNRARDPARRFALTREEVTALALRCLDAGAARSPARRVSIEVFELGTPPTPEDRARLSPLRRGSGAEGVDITPWILAPSTGALWSGAPLGGFFVGRRFFQEVMRGYSAAHRSPA
ncbi:MULTISPECIES: hypothetical protein [unclassified Corallococcus]|uniref:hypothetical protein n=1 Tax=unclassified Corallococcus TaxID=2685029 RepID=UPI001A90B5DD|nr:MULTISPECIES: hypothetical protein [unclassified Corallococcus]MBN9681071.1 hypothetical protein [Corallococcus sp. NCSPR001]WAS87335.1 hypothetical protein O0N60_10230 [Corallococcus sp. NCRR]